MPTPDGSSTEKRMPVLVFGYGNTKLLGVPSIGKKLTGKYGKTVAEEVHKLLQVWGCTNNAYGMVFDITPSNTGVKKRCSKLKLSYYFWFEAYIYLR